MVPYIVLLSFIILEVWFHGHLGILSIIIIYKYIYDVISLKTRLAYCSYQEFYCWSWLLVFYIASMHLVSAVTRGVMLLWLLRLLREVY